MVDYICLFGESVGFREFTFALKCNRAEDTILIGHELQRTILKARFDLPENVCNSLCALYYDVGLDLAEATSLNFEEEVDIDRKMEFYLKQLNEIMKDYIR